MISPTIARHVLFMPAASDAELRRDNAPLAAVICKVVNDRQVNLMVVGPQGTVYGRQNVLLLHGEEPPTDAEVHYCNWVVVPGQKGEQTEALIKGLTTTLATAITRIAALEAKLVPQPEEPVTSEAQKAAMAAYDARVAKEKL